VRGLQGAVSVPPHVAELSPLAWLSCVPMSPAGSAREVVLGVLFTRHRAWNVLADLHVDASAFTIFTATPSICRQSADLRSPHLRFCLLRSMRTSGSRLLRSCGWVRAGVEEPNGVWGRMSRARWPVGPQAFSWKGRVSGVKLTRFRGHRSVWVQGVHDGQDKIALRT
jgi:hypothetical protein